MSRTFLSISAILLFVLLALRVGWPQVVVNQPAGYALSISWAFMLFLGLALWKGLNIAIGSAGTPITYISTCFVAGATNFVLGLGLLGKAETNPAIEVFFITITPIILFVWWKVLWRGDRNNS